MKSSVMTCLLAVAPAAFAIPATSEGALSGRQFGSGAICCAGQCSTEVIGNEESWNLHMQVTENHDCGNGGEGSGCDISHLNSKSVGWSVDGGITAPWASLGGSVSKSITTGTTKGCSAERGTVCVWARIPHTAYDAQKIERLQRDDTCDEQPNGPYQITAPNGSHEFYCVHGDACREDGAQYWEQV